MEMLGGKVAQTLIWRKCWDTSVIGLCMLHTNELPLRHPIKQLDGPTTSKDGFTGPVVSSSDGRQLHTPARRRRAHLRAGRCAGEHVYRCQVLLSAGIDCKEGEQTPELANMMCGTLATPGG